MDQQSKTKNQLVGITMGDPAGIGPEIILKALRGTKRKNIVLIGSLAVFEEEKKRLRINTDLPQIIDTGSVGKYQMGRVEKNSGVAALKALELGVTLLKEEKIAALVTAPVAKEALRLAGFSYPGQTELLAARLGVRRYAMLAWSPNFKVVFVTIHLPIAQVSRHITTAAVREKIYLLDKFLRLEGSRHPKIAVFALNPHSEEFSLGEEKKIAQAVTWARKQGIIADGPFPADSLFARGKEFDGFVAMYHDQAMIPAKILSKGKGVNVTLGLGKIRTSPLHGVAFDIAGKGIASASSMLAAIKLAQHLIRGSTIT
ncbi:MAG: 4-hydroxythreonine-4-phosphate dehydrogenase PdxA [candidate division WOR-3 bacterium]